MKEGVSVIPGAEVRRVERDPCSITVMPDRETLEAFLRGHMGGPVTVCFDIRTGTFEHNGGKYEKD